MSALLPTAGERRRIAATATQARRLAAGAGYPVTLTLVCADRCEAQRTLAASCAAEVRRGFEALVLAAWQSHPAGGVVGVRVLAAGRDRPGGERA